MKIFVLMEYPRYRDMGASLVGVYDSRLKAEEAQMKEESANKADNFESEFQIIEKELNA